MILLIDIPDKVYESIKVRNGSGYFTPKEIECMDQTIRTGVQFNRFKKVASDRITEAIKELNEDGAIAELEKIKSEMKELAFLFDDLSPDKEFVVDLDNIEKVIDKHIAELKGENK